VPQQINALMQINHEANLFAVAPSKEGARCSVKTKIA
jgi:hypothetical protein